MAFGEKTHRHDLSCSPQHLEHVEVDNPRIRPSLQERSSTFDPMDRAQLRRCLDLPLLVGDLADNRTVQQVGLEQGGSDHFGIQPCDPVVVGLVPRPMAEHTVEVHK